MVVRDSIVVLKFGSSVLRSRADLPGAVHEIYRWYRDGHRVIAVVSAIGDATDLLLAGARDLASDPEPYALAELLATGERASAALLGIALDRVGIRARVIDPRDIGLLALGDFRCFSRSPRCSLCRVFLDPMRRSVCISWGAAVRI